MMASKFRFRDSFSFFKQTICGPLSICLNFHLYHEMGKSHFNLIYLTRLFSDTLTLINVRKIFHLIFEAPDDVWN